MPHTSTIYRFYMQLDEILNHFKDPKGKFPKDALNSALNQQEEITPHLLNILENVITNHDAIQMDQMDYIFSLYVLSKFREKKAFPYILAFASLPGELPEDLLGDCITEALARFIVSTFNGELLSIKTLIENPELNEWSRNAALNSLVGLVAIDKLKREELIDYLRSLLRSTLADNEMFTTRLVSVASDIYPEELMDEINQAFDDDMVDIYHVDKQWIAKILETGKEECLSRYVYNDQFHLPIDNVEEDMVWMSAFEKPQTKRYVTSSDYGNFTRETAITFARATPKVGRNELCPCGSGKKFKKCCLN